MATRSLWGSLLGSRRSAEPESEHIEDQQPASRKSHSQVQTLCSMRTKSNNIGSASSISSSSSNGAAPAEGSLSNNSPDQVPAPALLPEMQANGAPDQGPKSATHVGSPFSAASGANKVSGSTNSHATGAASGLTQEEQGMQQSVESGAAHDSATSTFESSDSAGYLSRDTSNSKAPPAAAVEPSAPTDAVSDAERTLSLSVGLPDRFSASNLASTTGLPASTAPAQQQQGEQGPSNSMGAFPQHSDMSFMPSTMQDPAGQISSSAQLHAGSSAPSDGTPRLSSTTGMAGGLSLFGPPGGSCGLGSGVVTLQGPESSGHQGAAGPSFEALMADLQAIAGLTAEQAAAAAGVMMQHFQPPAPAPHPLQSLNVTANPWAHTPPGQDFGTAPPLSPTGPLSPMALNPLSLNPGHTPDMGSAFLAAGHQADLLGSPAAALGAAGAFGGALLGFDSVHSSSTTNVVSGTGFGLAGSAAGMLSPEQSYLAEAAAYAHDGLDVPGTAQVAVHNVPFKWCNDDLEELFRQQEGYLDAQLLFHENGRSKGVGVGLFRDRACAVEACNKLSGAQADGRKLELVLMNPDNHVSFSCRQVAVLGLPWEYTSADVRALLEAAAEADGAAPAEAGVEHVEVAYRDDGKSEGRAIATFASRRQAHDAIRRLHGKETLAGLRMRLFYLHEQQQMRNQHVLAQLRTQPQLLPSLIPGMAGLALGGDTPSPRHLPPLSGTPSGNSAARQLVFSNSQGAGPEAVNAVDGPGTRNGSGDGGSPGNAEGEGGKQGNGGNGVGDNGANGRNGGAVAPSGQASGEGRTSSEDPASNRSSFDKDQGPVILHVSGLMESVTREQLRELFSQAGEVTKVDIPDGGRSMGYGFITFSNPQAAEQAMLLFNNYPLGGGAIHVAYSTSATAKARQQALRQARKATLGNARASTDGGPGRQPGTPTGLAAAAAGRGRGPGVSSFPSNPSLGGLGGPGLGGLDALNPARRSFEHPGYSSSMGGLWPRGGGPGLSPGGFGPTGISSSLGALGGTPPGMHAAAAMGQGRNRRNSYDYGLGGMGPPQLQMLQGAGGSAGYPAAMGPGGFDVSTAGNLDQQLQLLMQLTGTAGDAGFGGAGPGMLGVPGGAQPGTPPPAGSFRPAMAGGPTAGLFSTPMSAGAGGFGGLGGPGSLGGLSTSPGPFLHGAPGAGGLFGENPATAAAGQNLFSPSGMQGPGGMGAGGLMPGGVGGMEGPPPAGQQQQVLVTGLPPGLSDADLRSLFEICGPLRGVNKQPDQDFAIITYDSLEGASKAISVLDGTKLPSGSTLSLQFTSLLPETPAKTTGLPWNPAVSPAHGPGMYGAGAPGASVFTSGLATPPRGSFAGDGAPGGGFASGSLFPVAEAGNTGELFGGGFGGNVGGFSSYGGLGPVGSGLRVGATSPAFGRPPRDGSAVAAASGLYSTTPVRTGSPAPGGIAASSPVGPRLSSGGGQAGLPPMYAGNPIGMTSSGSAGNLFGRAAGAEGGLGLAVGQNLSGRGRTGSSGSDGGSAQGSDGGAV